MIKRPVPDFLDNGLLPLLTGEAGEVGRLSPYGCDMTDVRAQFGHTEHRLLLIDGLERYRQDLRTAGFRLAVQWLSGSFVERNAEPSDIDVVNFGMMPRQSSTDNRDLVEAQRSLFYKNECKSAYSCDPAFVLLTANPLKVAQSTTYGTTLFSYSKQYRLPRGFLALSGNTKLI